MKALTVGDTDLVEQALVPLVYQVAMCCRSTFVKALQDLGDAVTGQDTGIAWHNRFRYASLCLVNIFGFLRIVQCPQQHFVQ